MIRAIGFVLILVLTAARGTAAEPPAGAGAGSPPLKMEEVEVRGTAPLRMEEVEVRGRRGIPDVLYLPGHRGVVLPSPVRYDLFLEDMTQPVYPGPDGALKGR